MAKAGLSDPPGENVALQVLELLLDRVELEGDVKRVRQLSKTPFGLPDRLDLCPHPNDP